MVTKLLQNLSRLTNKLMIGQADSMVECENAEVKHKNLCDLSISVQFILGLSKLSKILIQLITQQLPHIDYFTKMSTIITVNEEKFLLWQSQRKLTLLRVPQLKTIQRFYIEVGFVSCTKDGLVMVISKNVVTFLKPVVKPLRLIESQQEFLEWEPMGGLCLNNTVVLHDSHSIIFHDRLRNFEKSWSISVVQNINQIKSSENEQFIGMKVQECNNVIYLWNLHEISTKPNQEISVTQPILQWEFYHHEMLVLLTKVQFRVYLPMVGSKEHSFYLQYYIQIQRPKQFCWLQSSFPINMHESRRSVHTIAIYNEKQQLLIYELYDILKRMKVSLHQLIKSVPLRDRQIIKRITGGWAVQNKVFFVGQGCNMKPFSWELGNRLSKFLIDKVQCYKGDLGEEVTNIVYKDGILAVQKSGGIIDFVELQGKNCYNWLNTIKAEGGCLGFHYFYEIGKDKFVVHPIRGGLPQQIEAKCPESMHLILEKENVVHFVAGVRFYKFANKKLQANGMVLRNPNAKLIEANRHTQSLLYKIGNQHVLMEYTVQDKQKVTVKTVKSSDNKLVSLRNGKWAELTQSQITVGQQQQIMAKFSLSKMYKILMQQHGNYQYKFYWITHHGMALIVQNYLFVLQLVENADGYALQLLKKGHSYLHKRFSPYSPIIELLNPRQMIIRTNNRVLRLGNKLGNLVSEDPYSLPQTIILKQLQTRKFYPPHHPKVIDCLIGSGYFYIAIQILTVVYDCMKKGSDLKEIYRNLNEQFFIKNGSLTAQEVRIKMSQNLSSQVIDQLKSLAELILEQPEKVVLEESGPLYMQSQIQSIIYKDENSRSMDFFSSIVLTQLQMCQQKATISLNTRQVVFLAHSMNKQQALGFLKPERMSWDWLKKYCVPFWYSNVEAIKKWIQQIAGDQFRKKKQPLDCLFWYTLIGKKALLMTLFKANQHSSKQHAAILNFLQRDFSQANHQSAAAKNAYVLMDKKRHYHSLAFFILGGKFEECIAVCLSRMNDPVLAYTLCLLFNVDKSKLLNEFYEKGDVWARHLSLHLKGNHIDSYNCLFEDLQSNPEWNYDLKLAGFHPSIINFAEQLVNSVPVKRELQEQENQQLYKHQQSSDIFDSFYSKQSDQVHSAEEEKPKKQLLPNQQKHKKKALEFYLQNSFPALALVVDPQNREAKRAYQLEAMMLTGKITPSVEEVVEEMENVIGMLKMELTNKQTTRAQIRVKKFYQNFQKALKKINLTEVYRSEKEDIGNALYYCYHSEEIIKLIQYHRQAEHFNFRFMKQMTSLSLIMLSLQLKVFAEFDRICQFDYKDYKFNTEMHWGALKSEYNKMTPNFKIKHPKLMDSFQYAFQKFARRQKQQGANGLDIVGRLSLDPDSSVYLIFNSFIVGKAAKKADQLADFLNELKSGLLHLIKVWVDPQMDQQTRKQLDIIKKQGSSCRLKLNFVSVTFDQSFETIANGIARLNEIKENVMAQKRQQVIAEDKEKSEIQAVQIFRNKTDGVRSFTINRNQGQGMEIAVLFKKNFKKMEICQSLAQRNRSSDGYYLLQEDPLYNASSTLNVQNLLQNPNQNRMLQDKILKVINNRRSYDGTGPINNSMRRGDSDYLRPLDPIPYVDHNQLNCIECHYFLPVFLIGGKGLIDVFNFSTLKNFNRIQCPTLNQITKIWSYEHRLTAIDSSGNLSTYNFDSKYTNNCVFSLKKTGIIDFCPLNPSTYGTLSNNMVQVYDTLLHPNRQSIFKLKISNDPVAIRPLKEMQFVIMRKSELLIYDIRMDKLSQTQDIEVEGRSLATNHNDKVIAGRVDGKIKIFDLTRNESTIIKAGKTTEKKNPVEAISIMGKLGVCLTSEGSIFMFDNL